MSEIILEACVESIQEAFYAFKNGAHRLELCSSLKYDGLFPELHLIKEVQSNIEIPIKVMIRPRTGDFHYDKHDFEIICDQIEICHELQIKEIVFGALKNNSLDLNMITKIAQIAFPMEITIHKAIDLSSDPIEDLERLKEIPNICSVLSSGQKPKAIEGIKMLKAMNLACSEELQLIVAGKVTQENIDFLRRNTGAKEYHGRKIV